MSFNASCGMLNLIASSKPASASKYYVIKHYIRWIELFLQSMAVNNFNTMLVLLETTYQTQWDRLKYKQDLLQDLLEHSSWAFTQPWSWPTRQYSKHVVPHSTSSLPFPKIKNRPVPTPPCITVKSRETKLHDHCIVILVKSSKFLFVGYICWESSKSPAVLLYNTGPMVLPAAQYFRRF